MKSRFLNSTMLIQPLWAPPGEGGGEGGDDDFIDGSDELNMLENGDGDPEGTGESEGNEEISLDGDDFLANLFEPPKDKDGNNLDPEDDSDAGDSEEEQTALAERMKTNIAGIGIPENAIPDDFDPSDPKQFRDVVGAIQRQTVQDTIRIIWEPIAAAMNQTHTRMRAEMAEAVEGGIGENNITTMVSREIPNYNNKGFRPVIQTVLKQARVKHPKDPAAAVAATKKALQAMGVPLGTNKPGDKPRTREGARAQTNSILDQFARLPQKVSAAPGTRLTQRLQKPKS